MNNEEIFDYLKNNLSITLEKDPGGESSRIEVKLFLKNHNYSPGYGLNEWELITRDSITINERLD